MTYFTLGRSRTLQAVADNLGEHPSTVKNWSARHHWVERIQNHQSAVLQKTAEDQATSERQHAAAWTKRLNALREREWETSERLFSAAQCFLESFGDEDLSKMTLGQVSRAVSISSQIGRSALLGVELPPSTEPALAPIQVEFMQALERAYGHLAKNDGKDAASPGSKDATPN